MDWNKSYANNRDFTWLPTQHLTKLLLLSGFDTILPKRALDIGCGTGQLVRDLYHRGISTTGIDTSSAAIAIAKNSTTIEGAVSFFNHDISEAPLDETYDFITCKYVFTFIKDRGTFLKNVTHCMSTDKQSVFALINPDPALLPEHKKGIAIDPSELKKWLARYFEDIATEHVNGDLWYICKTPLKPSES